MDTRYDLEVGGIGFIAVEPRDARMIRRGGVLIWARYAPGGLQLLSVTDSPMISAGAGPPHPAADVLLVSPSIIDGRRRRGVRLTIEQAIRSPASLMAAA